MTKGYKKALKVSPAWAEAYLVTEQLIKKYNVKVMAEIGVARGHHSAHLLEAIPDLKVYSVDPWGTYIGEHNPMYQYHSFKDDDKIYKKVVKLLKRFNERSIIIRTTSQRAVINEKLDMVFIDADHTYKGVKEDIRYWLPKIKKGGIISGHDYGHSSHPGVKKAVDKYFKKVNVKNSVWWTIL